MSKSYLDTSLPHILTISVIKTLECTPLNIVTHTVYHLAIITTCHSRLGALIPSTHQNAVPLD